MKALLAEWRDLHSGPLRTEVYRELLPAAPAAPA